MKSLLDMSAMELAHAIRERRVSPVEAVKTHIRHIEIVNPVIGAVVAPCFERALSDAHAAERRVMHNPRDELPPLLGVPFTVKEGISVADMPWTAGLKARIGELGPRDATAVTRLRQAGAVLVGTTNLPELALWYESYNKVYGRTSNPWDVRHTAGGSSGGEASIVAAGGVPMGLGSDAGGSIRVPAAFCGAVGHKPSGRRVPGTGHLPVLTGLAPIAQIGPLARRVGDVAAMLNIISGPDGEDEDVFPYCDVDLAVGLPEGLRVFYCDGLAPARASAEVLDAVTRATTVLAERGAQVQRWNLSSIGVAAEMWASAMHVHGMLTFSEQLGINSQAKLAWELLKLPFGAASFTAPTLAVALIEDTAIRLTERLSAGAAQRQKWVARFAEILGADGVVISPVYPTTAPKHGLTLVQPLAGFYAALFNALEAPATSIPVGMSEAGMPLAVQVVARPGNDGLCLRVAQALEASLGGWRRAHPGFRQIEAPVRAAPSLTRHLDSSVGPVARSPAQPAAPKGFDALIPPDLTPRGLRQS